RIRAAQLEAGCREGGQRQKPHGTAGYGSQTTREHSRRSKRGETDGEVNQPHDALASSHKREAEECVVAAPEVGRRVEVRKRFDPALLGKVSDLREMVGECVQGKVGPQRREKASEENREDDGDPECVDARDRRPPELVPRSGDEIPESRQPAAADQEKREPDWPQNNGLRKPRRSQKEETKPDSDGARSEQQGQLSLDGFLSPEKPRENVADDERRSKNSRSRQESRKIPRTHDEEETEKTEGDYSRPRRSPDDGGEHEESE